MLDGIMECFLQDSEQTERDLLGEIFRQILGMKGNLDVLPM